MTGLLATLLVVVFLLLVVAVLVASFLLGQKFFGSKESLVHKREKAQKLSAELRKRHYDIGADLADCFVVGNAARIWREFDLVAKLIEKPGAMDAHLDEIFYAQLTDGVKDPDTFAKIAKAVDDQRALEGLKNAQIVAAAQAAAGAGLQPGAKAPPAAAPAASPVTVHVNTAAPVGAPASAAPAAPAASTGASPPAGAATIA